MEKSAVYHRCHRRLRLARVARLARAARSSREKEGEGGKRELQELAGNEVDGEPQPPIQVLSQTVDTICCPPGRGFKPQQHVNNNETSRCELGQTGFSKPRSHVFLDKYPVFKHEENRNGKT